MLAALFGFAMAVTPAGPISDEELVKYASRFHGSHDWNIYPQNGVFATHHGATVVTEVHCGDVCPDYTRLIIHYGVQPSPECGRIGGVAEHVGIPASITVIDKVFCVPRVLADKHLYSAP
jgi:hypothetical protein